MSLIFSREPNKIPNNGHRFAMPTIPHIITYYTTKYDVKNKMIWVKYMIYKIEIYR